jgi:hypothetical protein
MALIGDTIRHLLQGPLLETAAQWPITLRTLLCDLGRTFLPKGRAGRGYRAVARNGRVLLASDRPVAELTGQIRTVRFQTWHRAILAGDSPTPYGLLLYVTSEGGPDAEAPYDTRLVRTPEVPFALALDLGGRLILEFRPR